MVTCIQSRSYKSSLIKCCCASCFSGIFTSFLLQTSLLDCRQIWLNCNVSSVFIQPLRSIWLEHFITFHVIGKFLQSISKLKLKLKVWKQSQQRLLDRKVIKSFSWSFKLWKREFPVVSYFWSVFCCSPWRKWC